MRSTLIRLIKRPSGQVAYRDGRRSSRQAKARAGLSFPSDADGESNLLALHNRIRVRKLIRPDLITACHHSTTAGRQPVYRQHSSKAVSSSIGQLSVVKSLSSLESLLSERRGVLDTSRRTAALDPEAFFG